MKKEPVNLDEMITFLKKEIDEQTIEKIKNEDACAFHHSIGRAIRNKFSLWGDSKLKDWFNGIGIFHPDDMSGIILESLKRDLKGEPIDLDRQVKRYQAYWEKMKNVKSGDTIYVSVEK